MLMLAARAGETLRVTKRMVKRGFITASYLNRIVYFFHI